MIDKMLRIGLAVLLFSSFVCEGGSTPVAANTENVTSSADELLQKMLKIAASTDAEEQNTLFEFLSSKESIYQLDPREDHIRLPTAKLRLAQLFQAIRGNDSAAMHETLSALVRAGKPENCDACDTLLIKALAMVRPPTKEILNFWQAQSAADSVQIKFVIDALAENGTVPAIALLEKRLLDTGIEPEQKIAWMHDAILQHRRNAVLLASLDRILTTSLAKDLRPYLVESLFDYRPQTWYRTDSTLPVADSRPLTPEARRLLKKIGQTALKTIALTATQRQAVKNALKELS